MLSELPGILLDSLLAYVFVVFFLITGRLFLKKTALDFPGIGGRYGLAFYSLVFGLVVIVTLYSVIVARGITVNILIIPILLLFLKRSGNANVIKNATLPYLETAIIVLIAVIVLHLFPESEYKQNDSLYYLKIAESLNRTGQENTHHYYNTYSDIFHGTDPYHYFEIWCTALVSRLTTLFRSAIDIHRFVVQAVFITAIILGLYNIVSLLVKKQPLIWHKLFCWSLVFFMPDVIAYLPSLAEYFVSNIEGNFLERPNFRIVYILLVAVIAESLAINPRIPVVCCWLLLLATISFKFTVLLIPAMILVGIFQGFYRKRSEAKILVWSAAVFAVCFALFYLITGVDKLPSFYRVPLSSVVEETTAHWKFVLYSVFASLLYILIVAGVFLLPFIFIHKEQSRRLDFILRRHSVLLLAGLIGVVMARSLFMKDNAYQFLFVAHIIGLLLIWLIAANCLSMAGKRAWILAAMLFASPGLMRYLVKRERVDVFSRNGEFVYNGRKYSGNYIHDVRFYLIKNKLRRGAYLADTGYYTGMYYSRRNPNVYFPPLTYIISKNIDAAFDVCIADSAAIMHNIINPVHKDYLESAIQRSLFYQYRKQYPALSLQQVQRRFIEDHRISYLIAAPGVSTDFIADKISRIYKDDTTGERLLILKP